MHARGEHDLLVPIKHTTRLPLLVCNLVIPEGNCRNVFELSIWFLAQRQPVIATPLSKQHFHESSGE